MRRPELGRVPVLLAAAGLAAVTLAACEEHEFEPPDRAERVQEADQMFSQALFDSVTWASDSVRALEGNSVYAAECRQCHGPLGRGPTAYADERDLPVPSLVEPDWPMAGDLEAVRRRIFIGHPDGMPTWGVAGITPRQIDAAAFYILERLRPDVLEGGATVPGEPGMGGDQADDTTGTGAGAEGVDGGASGG